MRQLSICALLCCVFVIAGWKGNIAFAAEPTLDDAKQQLAVYRKNLDLLRQTFTGKRDLPDIRFFLFGMGRRPKLIYHAGAIKDALTGKLLHQWKVEDEVILPHQYTVVLQTSDGLVRVVEDELGVTIYEGTKTTQLAPAAEKLKLPAFAEYQFGPVLRVLHHEILINVIDGKPVPNFIVYDKPWYRDAAMMAMCLKTTDNVRTIQRWIEELKEPYDRNNRGDQEADNLGQLLYLISLTADKDHPLVKTVIAEIPKFEKRLPEQDSPKQDLAKRGSYIEGKTDFALHPVYQTKWLKFGLKSLSLDDPYQIPAVKDSYSPLFWWAYQDQHVAGTRHASKDYPYLEWAEDHFLGTAKGTLGNRDYPLSWESKASGANYPALGVLHDEYVKQKLSAPHTWHAAEMFLYLIEKKLPK